MKTAFLLLASLFLAGAAPLSARTITAAEYYFDTDPGPGHGTPIPLAAAGAVFLQVDVPLATIAALPDGVHFLTCRTLDDEGNWAIAISRAFHKTPVSALEQSPVVAAEYFIDSDPGPGHGTPLAVQAALSQSLAVDIPVEVIAALEDGVHFFASRMKDAQGDWSIAVSRAFYKETLFPDAVLARVESQWHLNGQPIAEAVSLNAPPNTATAFWLPEVPLPDGQEGDAFQLVLTPYDSSGNRGVSATREVTLAPPPTLEETLAAVFSNASPEDLGPLGNPLGDTLNNLQKYYLGRDPATRSASPAISIEMPGTSPAFPRGVRDSPSSSPVVLRFTRSRYTRDVTGTVEVSATLEEDSWIPVEAMEEVTPLDAFRDLVSLKPLPLADEVGRQFFRLKVVRGGGGGQGQD